MKLFSLTILTLMDGWSVQSLKIEPPYAGLIEGSPHDSVVKKMFGKVIHEITKNKSGYGEQALNRVPRYNPNELLKGIKVEVEIYQLWLEKHAKIITYIDESENIEDILNEIISDPLFVSGELVD